MNNYPATGYVITKYVHDDDAFSSPGGILMEKFFPIIRYAEILLAYSEALNNLQGSYSIELKGSNGETKVYEESRDIYKIKQAFNPIRYRVGLPGVKVMSWPAWMALTKSFKEKEPLNSCMRIKDTMTCADGASTKSPKKKRYRGWTSAKMR